MLLSRVDARMPALNALSVQLTAALEGPLLLYMAMSETGEPPAPDVDGFLGDGWQALVERVAR